MLFIHGTQVISGYEQSGQNRNIPRQAFSHWRDGVSAADVKQRMVPFLSFLAEEANVAACSAANPAVDEIAGQEVRHNAQVPKYSEVWD